MKRSRTETIYRAGAACLLLFAILMCAPASSHAASLGDSIMEIPEGTLFELRYELEIPANRDYIIVGQRILDEAANEMSQTLNSSHGKLPWHTGHGRHHGFVDYTIELFESYGQTYQKCLERHRRFYSVENPASDNVIVNQGSGNTNVIVNNSPGGGTTTGSYIGPNNCIEPDHTITALLIDKDAAGAGGIFRSGHKFKVKRVKKESTRYYNLLIIYFDHDVAEGLAVVTTHSLENIAIRQLKHSVSDEDSGFWASVGDVLGSLNNIAGNHFEITLPETEYFD